MLQAGAAGYLLKNLNAEEFFLLLAGLERGAPPIAPELAACIRGELGQATLQLFYSFSLDMRGFFLYIGSMIATASDTQPA